MSRDTIQALKKYLKLFEEKGLRHVCSENVVVVEKDIIVVFSRLKEVDTLSNETVINVLTGLTLCSVPKFSKVFDHLLQAAKAQSLVLDKDEQEERNNLSNIKEIMSRAVKAYHALCTAFKWHLTTLHRQVNLSV